MRKGGGGGLIRDQGNGWHSNWKLLNNESPRDFIQTLNKNDQRYNFLRPPSRCLFCFALTSTHQHLQKCVTFFPLNICVSDDLRGADAEEWSTYFIHLLWAVGFGVVSTWWVCREYKGWRGWGERRAGGKFAWICLQREGGEGARRTGGRKN